MRFSHSGNRLRIGGGLAMLAIAIAACGGESATTHGGAQSSTASSTGAGGGQTSGAGGAGGAACPDDVAAPDQQLPGTTDPEAGMFTMDEALVDLPDGPGPLRAIITTEKGTIECQLYPDKAPNGVANFVGLARGRRAWKDPATGTWVLRRFYDGLTFHRVIENFVAQGGDPLGTGYGGPGYTFADEISDLKHVAGTLAYANAGPNTNGSQFYITDSPQPQLDGSYTIFGLCSPLEVIQAITSTPTDSNDRPLVPIHTETVRITRCAP